MNSPAFNLVQALSLLTPSQVSWIGAFVQQFRLPYSYQRNPASDLVTDVVLENIGDLLRIHHAMSKRSLSKAPFEYAFEKALQLSGIPARLADSSTNPGYDMTIGPLRVSLKTQADRSIRRDQLHVSKWMELGAGDWDPPNVQLPNFLHHMTGYDRILTLRCLVQTGTHYWYELVEIPHALMLQAAHGQMEERPTRQATAPWYCHVPDGYGGRKFSLYFDSGSERKLQVKALQKTHCIVHATWEFDSCQLTPDNNGSDG